jgi:hypothetical protein
MTSVRTTFAAILLGLWTCAGPASATSFSNDQSDIWWNANESGWGIQFVQRGNTIFATMFVYDAAGNPTWYVAAMTGSKPNGVLTFTGDLYSSYGPWFGTDPFDPHAVGGAQVGTMTWEKQSGSPGTLTYSVNGVNVVKTLTRQPIGTDNYAGHYLAGIHYVATSCTNPADNGPTDGASTLVITQDGAQITLALAGVGCTVTGTYAQNGQFGTVSGTYSCSYGDSGSAQLSNMVVTPVGMVAGLTTTSSVNACQNSGQLGGARTDK